MLLACLQFVPFIQGPRNCMGQYFALLEARIVVGMLVKVSRARCLDPEPLHGCSFWGPRLDVPSHAALDHVS